jgi:hypothetical protein
MTTYVVHATDGSVSQVRDRSIAMAAAAARAIVNEGKTACVRTSFNVGVACAVVRREGDVFAVSGKARYVEQLQRLLDEHA